MRYGMHFLRQDKDLGFSNLILDPDVPSSPAGVGAYLICILLINMQILWIYSDKYRVVYTTQKSIIPVFSLQLLSTQDLTMGWSCIILFLVAAATGKGLTVAGLRSGHTLGWQWHPLSLSLHRCPLPGPTAAAWGWACDAWGFSEAVLQGFWLHLHQLLDALGEAEAWRRPWVDWKYLSW